MRRTALYLVLAGLLASSPFVIARAAGTDMRLPQAAKNQDWPTVQKLLGQKVDPNLRLADGSTALLWAAHWNDADMADLLLKAGADPNAFNEFKARPLSEACLNASAPIVRSLLAAGADPNAAIATGETPIMTCARTGNVDAVKALLAKGADANAKEPAVGQTALMWAIAEHHPDVAQALITGGADPKAKTRRGFTPLHFAAREGELEGAKILVAAGVPVDIRSEAEGGGRSSGRGRGRYGRGRGAAAAGDAGRGAAAAADPGGADAAAPGRAGRGAATADTASGGAGAASAAAGGAGPAGGGGRALVNTDAVSDESYNESNGSTPLLVATMKGQIPLALFLLDKEASPNEEGAGWTPLHWAAGVFEGEQSNPSFGFSDPMSGIPNREGKIKLIKALLAHGADPNAKMTQDPPSFAGGYKRTKVGATPAFLAAYALDLEVLKILKDAGADLTIKNSESVSPLMVAAGVDRNLGYSDAKEDAAIEVVNYLIANGDNAGDVSSFGENALHGVAYLGWNRLLQILVDHGAQVNVVSKAGTTPWLAASGLGDRQGGVNYNKETAALLEKLGANPKLGAPCQAQGACREQQ